MAAKTTAKDATSKKAAAKKATAKKATAKKATAKKATAKKATAKKATAKKATAKKATAKKATAKKATAKKTTAGKATAKKAPAKKTTAKKATAKSPGSRSNAATKSAAAKSTAKKSTRKRVPPVRTAANEKPWTAKEMRDLRAEIESDIAQLEAEIEVAETDLRELMQDAGDGAGDDQADAGAKTFEREQEISLVNNARNLLEQNRMALDRMDDGSYGTCANCGEPIGKLRLQAAPRATLCMPCKTKQERR